MLRAAAFAIGVAWYLQHADTRFLLAVPVVAWAAGALLAWCVRGGTAALVVLAAGWTLTRADVLIGARLPESLAGRDILVSGTLCDFASGDAGVLRFVLEVDRQAGSGQLPERIQLSWYDDAPALRAGQRWRLEVRLKPPRGFVNPGGFDLEQWLFVRGIGATGYVRRSRLNARLPEDATRCAVGRVRSALASRIESALAGHPATPYVLGVAVGATQGLAAADWELLRQTGTTHLLAISGLNIAMVAAPFLLAGRLPGRVWGRLAGRPHAGVLPALAAAASYSALAGFAVSTVRALAMLGIAATLRLRGRRVAGVDLLAAAGLAIVAADPTAAMSLGFWLSFLAVAWLFVAADPHPRERPPDEGRLLRLARAAGGLGRTQLVLGLGLAPLTLGAFQQVSLIAPVANLVAVPVFSLIVMPLTLLGAALVVPLPAAGAALLVLAAEAVVHLLGVLRLLAALPAAMWVPPSASPAGLMLATLGAALLCWWRPLPARPLALLWLLPLLFGTRSVRPELRATVLDVGQGLAVLVETRRHALLYDAGPAFRSRDAGESIVLPALRALGVRRLDVLVVSHDDQDHRGGAGSVLGTHPDALLIAPERMRLPAHEYRPCTRGLEWTWDGVRFSVLSPDAAGWSTENDGSCVLRVATAHASLLLPGDIEGARESWLRHAGLLAPADVVVAPHHGSRSSSSAAFVDAVLARWVIFSAGHRNRWGFPAAAVAQRWRERGACLLDTAESGAIVLAAGEAGWRLERRERLDGAHLWTTRGAASACASAGVEAVAASGARDRG